MTGSKRRWGRGAIVALATLGIAAATPRALSPAPPGLWGVAHSARSAPELRMCLANPALLAQYEHRGRRCRQTLLADRGNRAVIDYVCDCGGFGRSEITLVTPRTLRIATQGIAAEGPFNTVLHARWIGRCARR